MGSDAGRKIVVLRLGHRPERDKRITTHVALVARAFGASSMILTVKDSGIEERIRKVNENFGGNFSVVFRSDWKGAIREFEGQTVHLTMYGEKLPDAMEKLKRDGNILVIVGAEKVPADVYAMADVNVSVGNQPHSEVSALAIFLDRLLDRAWERSETSGKLRIIPSSRGKHVIGTDKEKTV